MQEAVKTLEHSQSALLHQCLQWMDPGPFKVIITIKKIKKYNYTKKKIQLHKKKKKNSLMS